MKINDLQDMIDSIEPPLGWKNLFVRKKRKHIIIADLDIPLYRKTNEYVTEYLYY